MARVSRNDPALYDIYVIEDRIFGACAIESHDGCMDGVTYMLTSRAISFCQCRCHSEREQTGRQA